MVVNLNLFQRSGNFDTISLGQINYLIKIDTHGRWQTKKQTDILMETEDLLLCGVQIMKRRNKMKVASRQIDLITILP